MKFTQEQLIQLVKALGVANAEVVADAGSATFDLDAALQSVDDSRTAIIRPKLESDIQKKAETAAAGKYGGLLRQNLRKIVGMSNGELEKIEKDDEAIKAAFDYFVGQTGKKGDELQAEMQRLMEAHTKALDEQKTSYETRLSDAERQYQERDIVDYLETNVLAKAPVPTNANKKMLASKYKEDLDRRFIVKWNAEKNKPDLFYKDRPEVPVTNTAGTQMLEFAEDAKGFFEPLGVWQTNMSNQNPNDLMNGGNGGSGGGANDKADFVKGALPQNPIEDILSVAQQWANKSAG